MKLTWEDLTVKFDHLTPSNLLKEWRWLINENWQPLLVSAFGDIFMKDLEGRIQHLNISTAEIITIANDPGAFAEGLQNPKNVDEWFLMPILGVLKSKNINLKEDEIYGLKVLPILGGKFVPENFITVNLMDYINLTGQTHFKAKEIQDTFDNPSGEIEDSIQTGK